MESVDYRKQKKASISSTGPVKLIERVKSRAYESLMESQLHGIPRLVKHDTFWLFRLIWLFCLVISLVGCSFFIRQGIINYLQYETVSRISVVNEIPSEIPAVSFCNINPFLTNFSEAYVTNYLERNKFTHGQVDGKLNEYLRYFVTSSVLSANLTDEERQHFSVSMKEFIACCSTNGQSCDLNKIEWYFDGYFGNCYSINTGRNLTGQSYSPSEIIRTYKSGNLNGIVLTLFLAPPYSKNSFSRSYGAHVAVHNKSRRATFFEGFDIKPGTLTKIGIKRTLSYRLPLPYTNCISLDSVKSYGSIFTDVFSRNHLGYTQNDCFIYCFQRRLVDVCSCYDPSFGQLTFNKTPCWSLQEYQCEMQAFNTFFQTDVYQNCSQECPLECESVNYDLVLSYSDWPTIYYCELLLNTSSFISDRYSHLTTLDEKCAAIKKSMLRLNIFYDAIEYTRIEEWPKMYLQDLGKDQLIMQNINLFCHLFFIVKSPSWVE